MKRNVWSPTGRVIGCVVLAVWATTPTAFAAPKLGLESNEIDIGRFERGAVAESVIKVTNAGDAPLELKKIQVSCPCTTVELPPPNQRVLAPGASVGLPVTYDTKDKLGDVGSTVVLHTNDPETPIALIDLMLHVESLVVYTPDTGVGWTLAPRGGDIPTPLMIMSGNEGEAIELVEVGMAKPGITPHAESEVVNGRSRVKVTFSIDPDVSMGLLTNEVHARVRVGETEKTITVPLRGGVVGDVLITPPAIISPRTAYAQGGRISEITVRSSFPDRPAPELIGVQVVGPLHAEISPETSDKDERVIVVAAASDAPGGPQGGTVFVMTKSEDDPIVAVPVYFRMADAVRAQPDHAVLYADDPTQASQRIQLVTGPDPALTIKDVRFDPAVLDVRIASPSHSESENAAIEIGLAKGVSGDAHAATVVIETDRAGAAALSIPVLVRNRAEMPGGGD